MLDTVFHELELRKQIGPEVVHIPINELLNSISKITEKKAEEELKNKISLEKIKNIEKETVIESIKIYLATKKLVFDNKIDAIAFKCWPDLKNNNVCSPCFTLSALSDDGVMSACEGDVTSAVSMLILHLMTGKNVFLGDMLKIDNNKSEILYSHCGAMSKNLSEDFNKIEYRIHADPENVWKPGLTVEFPLKPGELTFARVGEISGKYRMLAYKGKAIESEMFVRGNPAKVIVNKDPEKIVKNLIKNGSEHHQIAVHSNILKELSLLCSFLNIDFVEI